MHSCDAICTRLYMPCSALCCFILSFLTLAYALFGPILSPSLVSHIFLYLVWSYVVPFDRSSHLYMPYSALCCSLRSFPTFVRCSSRLSGAIYMLASSSSLTEVPLGTCSLYNSVCLSVCLTAVVMKKQCALCHFFRSVLLP